MRSLLPKPASRSFIAVVFAVLAAAIAGVGYRVYDYQRQSVGRDAEQRLTVIAQLRAQQVTACMS
jgi:hypothetical protein